jgi:hypothetical protein
MLLRVDHGEFFPYNFKFVFLSSYESTLCRLATECRKKHKKDTQRHIPKGSASRIMESLAPLISSRICVCDHRRLVSRSNYSATANLHNLPQHSLSLLQPAVFISRSLATASNSADSSVSRVHTIPGWLPSHN